MAYFDAIVSPRARDRPHLIRKNDELTLLEHHRLAPRLPARALLDEQKFTAFEIHSWAAQQSRSLEWKGELAVDVPVQAIVAL